MLSLCLRTSGCLSVRFLNSFRQELNIYRRVILNAAIEDSDSIIGKDLTASLPSIMPMSAIVRFCKIALAFLITATFFAYSIPAARSAVQQQPPEPQTSAAPVQPHKIKIWTNDDIVTLRTPADIYILEKEAQAAANEAKALMSCFAPSRADAEVEDTQKEIDAAAQSIRDAEAAVTQARKDLQAAPENLQARSRAELERRNLELDAYRDQLKLLQQRLQKLNAQPSATQRRSGENPSAPSSTEPHD